MWLRRRDLTPEYFDSPERTPAELAGHYEWLGRMNKLTKFERPFRIWVPRLVGEAACARLSLVDLGAGHGMLGRVLRTWAGSKGWDWRFTNVDLHVPAAAAAGGGTDEAAWVVAPVTRLPFPDQAFDVAIATTMTHHLGSDDEVIAHFREARRVARRAVLICDMVRSPVFLAALWAVMVVLGAPREFRRDGVLSVRRGWRPEEWRRLAAAAGLTGARVWTEHGTRILLGQVLPNSKF